MSGGKFVLLGLDGAEWSIIDSLISEGMLPNFRRMAEGGARGRLRSIIPVLTPPAWTSIFTGVNPGKHGILDFVNREGRICTSDDVLCPYVWDLLPDRKSIVFNTPFTYPPKKSGNVIHVSGFCTPGVNCEFTYPRAIKKELLELMPDYDIFLRTDVTKKIMKKRSTPNQDYYQQGMLEREKAAYLEFVMDSLESRIKGAEHLLGTKEWDSAFIVFSETDWLQHDTMHDFAVAGKKSATGIARLYARIDSFLGTLLDAGHNVMIVSDHGFQKLDRVFFVNTYLMKAGYVKLKKSGLRKPAMDLMKSISRAVFPFVPSALVDLMKRNDRFRRFGWRMLVNSALDDSIDTLASLAYLSRISGGLEVNSPGDVPAIVGMMAKATDGSGRKAIDFVTTREKAYAGPSTGKAPRVVLIPGRGIQLSAKLGEREFTDIDPATNKNGGHALFGVFLSYGPDITVRGGLDDVSVLDIAPTILSMMGQEVPPYMDGRPLPVARSREKKKLSLSQSTRLKLRMLRKR